MKKIIVFTGAGVSAESGLKTFRDSGGLWEEHSVEEVATPEAWAQNPELVLKFYNQRKAQTRCAEPNVAHYAIAELEEQYDVQVITQNIDDLHERAGSKNVLHLHGEILKARSCADPQLVYDHTHDLNLGDSCELGSQLRPHIVWFGEEVPMYQKALELVRASDILIIVGTSLAVYPAAGLVYHSPPSARKFLVDPKPVNTPDIENLTVISATASEGMPRVSEILTAEVSVD